LPDSRKYLLKFLFKKVKPTTAFQVREKHGATWGSKGAHNRGAASEVGGHLQGVSGAAGGSPTGGQDRG